jgi:hypothetical protein
MESRIDARKRWDLSVHVPAGKPPRKPRKARCDPPILTTRVVPLYVPKTASGRRREARWASRVPRRAAARLAARRARLPTAVGVSRRRAQFGGLRRSSGFARRRDSSPAKLDGGLSAAPAACHRCAPRLRPSVRCFTRAPGLRGPPGARVANVPTWGPSPAVGWPHALHAPPQAAKLCTPPDRVRGRRRGAKTGGRARPARRGGDIPTCLAGHLPRGSKFRCVQGHNTRGNNRLQMQSLICPHIRHMDRFPMSFRLFCERSSRRAARSTGAPACAARSSRACVTALA